MPYPTYEWQSDNGHAIAEHDHNIDIRAYSLWEKAGRPEGMRPAHESWQDFFWNTAEREISNSEKLEGILACASGPC
jgi:hypothetical protein